MGKIERPKQKARKGKATGLDTNKETKLNANSSVILAKKEKIKMRRQRLLNKIDKVQKMKKALKLREKRKTAPILGDMKSLLDGLPSMDALLKNKPSGIKQSAEVAVKKRGIEKQRKRKRDVIQGIKIYKSVLGNKKFLEDPWGAITNHVQVMVDQERQKQNS